MKKISIVIPVFNEYNSLLPLLERISKVDFGIDKEIILVDDFSTDGTKNLYQNLPYKVLYHDRNMGKGAALRTGINHAEGDIIIIQDADLEYNPEDYKPLVDCIKNGEAEVVYGSRFLCAENKKNFLFLSYIANRVLTLLTGILYNTEITDMETCYKAFKSDIIKSINIKSNGFDFEPEITAKILKKGIVIKELPISYKGRTDAEGKKVGWKDGIQAIITLFKYRFFN